MGPGSLPSQGSSEEPAEVLSTPEEYLLAVGLITRADLEKARDYKSGSRSEYGLGDILIMMGVIDVSDWNYAKFKAKDAD
ncbi:hypothetical protein [Desulfocurvus sp. DL9XJH121]